MAERKREKEGARWGEGKMGGMVPLCSLDCYKSSDYFALAKTIAIPLFPTLIKRVNIFNLYFLILSLLQRSFTLLSGTKRVKFILIIV